MCRRTGKTAVKVLIALIALIVVTVVVTAVVCSNIAGKAGDTTIPRDELSSWMDWIDDGTLVRKVAIPGSHDAGTYGMSWVAETQNRDVATQLKSGSRFFDLRVKVDKKGVCKIYHGPVVGTRLDKILDDIAAFLDENPSETLILEFQHFANKNADVKTYELLMEKLTESKIVFNEKGISNVEFINTVTLGETRGKCIVVWKGESLDKVASVHPEAARLFKREKDGKNEAEETSCLKSYYKRSWNSYYSSKKYVAKAVPAYINMYKAYNSGIFVLQSQLTDGSFICGPKYREGQHEKNMSNCVKSFATSPDLDYINVIMRDYVSPTKCAEIISLNLAKGNIKAGSLTAAEAFLSGSAVK